MHVIHNLHERLPDEAARREFVLPAFVEQMVERVSGVYLDLLSGRSAHAGRVKPASIHSEL